MDANDQQQSQSEALQSALQEALDQERIEMIASALKAGKIDAALEALYRHNPPPQSGRQRIPGRFKGQLVVGPEFFEPLSQKEIDEFTSG